MTRVMTWPTWGLLLAVGYGEARAGGPRVVEGDAALTWDTSAAVRYQVDLGPLGNLSNGQGVALVEEQNAVRLGCLRLAGNGEDRLLADVLRLIHHALEHVEDSVEREQIANRPRSRFCLSREVLEAPTEQADGVGHGLRTAGEIGVPLLEGAARQPEMVPMLQVKMFIVVALLDAVAMIGVGIALFFTFANPFIGQMQPFVGQ